MLLIRTLRLTLLLSLSTLTVNSAADDDGTWYYSLNGEEATIGGCVQVCSQALEIPRTVDGYSVTSIPDMAFFAIDIISVTIPDTVTSIGLEAFYGNIITSVSLPNSLTSIGEGAFSDNLLASVTIPKSLSSIANSAFSRNLLTTIAIPDSVTSIGDRSFETNHLSSITIPDSVTSIGESAFRDNQLTSVTIPDSVTSIGYGVFLSNSNLKSVQFLGSRPTTINDLGTGATITYCTDKAGWPGESIGGTTPIADCDGDGVLDENDLYPKDASESLDTDSDGIGNNADTDDDGDGVADTDDVFPLDATETIDTDGDGIGNNADTDDDGDTLADEDEISIGTNPLLTDTDNDGVTDQLDALPLDDSETLDTDGDGAGNNADTDDDGDGVADDSDVFPLDATETLDTDSDGTGNNSDSDDDGDGVLDSVDAYPLISLGGLLDSDLDGYPNECADDCVETGMIADADDDNDGVADIDDFFPLDASESSDRDGDGVGDNSDAFPDNINETVDSDVDGIGDNSDNCPNVQNDDQINTDGDLFGNACDLDDDNDGFTDAREEQDGTDPLNRFSCKSGCFSFDVDENLEAQPLTDGLLVIRHLFGFSGESLTSGAVSGEASRGSSEAIANYLTDADSQLDIDGDGESKPLTDGLLLIRYLFGFSGDSLVSGAIGTDATRDTAESVEGYIKERVPAS